MPRPIVLQEKLDNAVARVALTRAKGGRDRHVKHCCVIRLAKQLCHAPVGGAVIGKQRCSALASTAAKRSERRSRVYLWVACVFVKRQGQYVRLMSGCNE